MLSWQLSNTLDADFFVAVLQQAMAAYGRQEIFNANHGCQFTKDAFTSVLQTHAIRTGMDSKGRWVDNMIVERLWLSLKHEELPEGL